MIRGAYHCKKDWLVVLTTEWLPWLQETCTGYQMSILVLEVNCISNLSLNHTLQLATPRTSVRESLCMHATVKSDWLFYRRVVNLVAWLNVVSEDIFIKQPEKYREAVFIAVGHDGRLLCTVEVFKVAAVPR